MNALVKTDFTETQRLEEALGTGVRVCVLSEVRRMLSLHDNVPAAAGEAYRAPSMIQCIFVWSHVASAFKYPVHTCKRWSKYKIILNF